MADSRSSTSFLLLALLGLGAGATAQTQPSSPKSTPQPTAVASPQTPTRSVAEVPRSRIEAASRRIDEAWRTALTQRQLEPTAVVGDETFVRRVYLDVVGRNPSLPEVEAFLADSAPDKRMRLVDRLLDSAGWVSNESNHWFDLLRVKSRQRQLSGEPFAHWIRQSLRDGLPFDEFVTAMVTAEGPAHADGNGATGYLLRDANMPHDAMANTLRLFTGTRLECAQCHNHPFEQWKQRDFYAMAAFFGGLQFRVEVDRDTQQALRQQLADADDRTKQSARRALQTLSAGLRGTGTGVERLPADYAYEDAAPRSPIEAHTVYGPKAAAEPRAQAPAGRRQRPAPQRDAPVDSRTVFAEWLTSKKNDRFVRVLGNRMWERYFGRGLLDPVDDLKADSKASLPEVEKRLLDAVLAFDFDLRQLQRVLLSTDLYQRTALAGDPSADLPYAFPGPIAQRLRAEQVWDSLLVQADFAIDQTLREPGERAKAAYERQKVLQSDDPEAIVQALQRRPDVEAMAKERLQQIAERRALDAERQQRTRELTRELAAARRGGDADAQKRLQAELRELAMPRPGEIAQRARDGQRLRASDLEQPAPAGHLLRQFGQSDRETIDGASRSATVPQALTLMNGSMSSASGDLFAALRRAPDVDTAIRTAFLGVLARTPRPDELATWRNEWSLHRDEAPTDLLWVLTNGNEFRFRP